MPLTEKGNKIKSAMQEQYGKERGEQVFYASRNKGTISGVDAEGDMATKDQGDLGSSSTGSTGMTGLLGDTKDVGASSTVGGKTTGYQINTASDEDAADCDTRDADNEEIVGDIPKEKVTASKPDKGELAQKPTRTMASTLAPVTAMPLAIPVGDQSLSNMNARNRNFWRR